MILIAADIERVTGVVHWARTGPRQPEHARRRRLMTGGVNAASQGVLAGSADRVAMTDGPKARRNLLPEDLDPPAPQADATESDVPTACRPCRAAVSIARE